MRVSIHPSEGSCSSQGGRDGPTEVPVGREKQRFLPPSLPVDKSLIFSKRTLNSICIRESNHFISPAKSHPGQEIPGGNTAIAVSKQ